MIQTASNASSFPSKSLAFDTRITCDELLNFHDCEMFLPALVPASHENPVGSMENPMKIRQPQKQAAVMMSLMTSVLLCEAVKRYSRLEVSILGRWEMDAVVITENRVINEPVNSIILHPCFSILVSTLHNLVKRKCQQQIYTWHLLDLSRMVHMVHMTLLKVK